MIRKKCVTGETKIGWMRACALKFYEGENMFFVKGFSLLELLFVLVIAVILFSLLMPAYHVFFDASREQVLGLELLRVIRLARSEAILYGVPMTLCKTVDHVTCSGRWRDGQMLFLDEKRDGSVVNKERIVHVFDAVFDGELHWRSSLGRDYLQMLPSGLTRAENGTFWYCPRRSSKPVWAVVVNKSGRARLVLPGGSGELDMLFCK